MEQEKKRIVLQALLFVITFITTTIAGAEWNYSHSIYSFDNEGINFNSEYTLAHFLTGLPFSISFLFILSVHEFGHYFTARYHQIKTSLPYYIPLPPFPTLIGTMGALIRIRQRIPTTTKNFDIGVAGPVAGFVAAIIVLIIGLVTLPPPEFIFTIHPEYKEFGLDYAQYVYQPAYLGQHGVMDIMLADNLIINFLASMFADSSRMPNYHELMHYPLLFAGWLSLFFTALNLLPIGQLDGGHVVYGLFGKKIHRIIASVFFTAMVLYSGIGIITPAIELSSLLIRLPLHIFFLYLIFSALGFEKKTTIIISLSVFIIQYLITLFMPTVAHPSYSFLLLAFLMSRFVGVRHPGADVEEPLTLGRKILGWFALAILVLCFTPSPINIFIYPQ